MLREILVEDQNANNFLKLYKGDSPCCGDSATQCQQVATYAAANGLTAITIKDRDGNNKTLTFASASGAANVLAALRAAIYAEGYEEGEPGQFEGITVVAVSTNLQVTITGDLEVVSLTHAGGTANFSARACDQVNRCDYTVDEYPGGATNTLRINGVDYAVGAMTLTVTAEATIEGVIDGHLATSGIGGTSAVTDNTTDWTVVISGAKSDATIKLGTTLATRSNCAVVFE